MVIKINFTIIAVKLLGIKDMYRYFLISISILIGLILIFRNSFIFLQKKINTSDAVYAFKDELNVLHSTKKNGLRISVLANYANEKSILHELPVLIEYLRNGFSIRLVMPSNIKTKNVYAMLGFEDFSFMLRPKSYFVVAAQLMFNERDRFDVLNRFKLEEWINSEFKYCISTYCRIVRIAPSDLFKLEKNKFKMSKFILDSIVCKYEANILANEIENKEILVTDRGYTPGGQYFSAFVDLNKTAVSWNAAHRNNAYILKRFNNKNIDQHPSSVSNFIEIKDKFFINNKNNWIDLKAELQSLYDKKNWYPEVGTQAFIDSSKRVEIKTALPKVCIFPHIFYDGTFFWGNDLFEDYKEWFLETIIVAKDNPNIHWIIKLHPAHIVKNERDGHNVVGEKSIINDIFGINLPINFTVLEPTTPISTIDLIQTLSGIVTVRGTVGLEAAMFGKHVITAGTGRYSNLGFTVDFHSKERYLNYLKNLNATVLKNNRFTNKDLARKLGMIIFQKRIFEPKYLKFGYENNKSANLIINKNSSITEEFDENMKKFICSSDEDYLNNFG